MLSVLSVPKLSFQIDDEYLIAHTLFSTNKTRFSSNKYKRDIISFQNYAWNTSKNNYLYLMKEYPPTTVKNPQTLPSSLQDFLLTLKKSDQYQKIHSQTQKYLLFCRLQWIKNLFSSASLMQELTGVKIDKKFNVYITHPSLKNGINSHGKILWGHNEDWENYATVYLWHEILHSYISSSKSDKISHAIIQLIADNELRVNLNGGTYPPFYGHKELFPLMSKMLPIWKKYLKSKNKKNKNILTFKHACVRVL